MLIEMHGKKSFVLANHDLLVDLLANVNDELEFVLHLLNLLRGEYGVGAASNHVLSFAQTVAEFRLDETSLASEYDELLRGHARQIAEEPCDVALLLRLAEHVQECDDHVAIDGWLRLWLLRLWLLLLLLARVKLLARMTEARVEELHSGVLLLMKRIILALQEAHLTDHIGVWRQKRLLLGTGSVVELLCLNRAHRAVAQQPTRGTKLLVVQSMLLEIIRRHLRPGLSVALAQKLCHLCVLLAY